MSKRRDKYTSFYIQQKTREELEFLESVYKESHSAIIRRLITEAYTFVRNVPEVRKEGEKQ